MKLVISYHFQMQVFKLAVRVLIHCMTLVSSFILSRVYKMFGVVVSQTGHTCAWSSGRAGPLQAQGEHRNDRPVTRRLRCQPLRVKVQPGLR